MRGSEVNGDTEQRWKTVLDKGATCFPLLWMIGEVGFVE